MLSDFLDQLSMHESSISALVGILTLATALWGMLLLLFLPHRKRAAVDREPVSESPGSRPRAPWIALLDRGLTDRTELEDLISVRTTNASLICVMLFSLGWILTGLIAPQYTIFSIINFVGFLLALLAFVIHPTAAGAITRWLFISSLLFQWAAVMVVVGNRWGVEYFLAGVLLMPPLLFTRKETGQQRLALGLCVATLLLAVWLASKVSVDIPMSTTFRHTAYYANAAGLALLVVLILYFYNNSAVHSFHELEDQKAKSEALVRSILPDYVARRLAGQKGTVADWHQEASVLFATVYGFQELASRVSAVQLVELLSEIFVQFDQLVEQHGVEKINTLGTNYVVATGVDEDSRPDHLALARVAVGMRDVVARVSRSVNHSFVLRAGLSTGQVVSGVIGDARPSFDIWGETVELANILRGSALENTVVVNEACFWRLRDAFDFVSMQGADGRYLLCNERSAD